MPAVIRLFVVSICISFFSVVGAQQLKQGELMDSVYCNLNKNYSYALYVPSNYSPDTNWPVIFIFDPAARGELGVTVFRMAAEQYGYILACSNNSRNGPFDSALIAAQMMQSDVLSKFHINYSRMYTAGFSGGSKVASAIAILNKHIAGVIACGAGLPALSNNQTLTDSTIVYVAATGYGDMNYLEMREVIKELSLRKIDTRIFDFNGGHDWPDRMTAMKLITWLELQAMKHRLKKTDTAWLKQDYEIQYDTIQKIIAAGNYYTAWLELNYMIRDFTTVVETDSAKNTLQFLLTNKESKKLIEEGIEMLEKEKETTARYVNALQAQLYPETALAGETKNYDWWIAIGNDIRKLRSSKESYKVNTGERLYDKLWRSCYENSIYFMNIGDYYRADSLYRVWTLFDPENKMAWYHYAESQSMMGNVSGGLNALEHAVRLGVESAPLIESNHYFIPLHNTKTYLKIIAELKKEN